MKGNQYEDKKRRTGNGTTRGKGRPDPKGKRVSRNRSKSEQMDEESGTVNTSTVNDFSWYNTLPELTSAAAQFPFSRPLGTPITHHDNGAYGEWMQYWKEGKTLNTVPGFMSIEWFPTIGKADDVNSPINVVAREIYSFVRHANSGSANYDAPDLMMYLMAMDTIYSLYTDAVRAYGLANLYTSQNRYMPKYLLKAIGWDHSSIIGNMAQFRWAINNIAYKMSSLAVPNFMSYYLRHMWLNSGVYLDKPSAKAQMYAFKQHAGYKYVQQDRTRFVAKLEYFELPSFTPDSWLTLMNDLIDPLLGSEDMGIMSGDILKAFGQDNLFSVAPIGIDYVVLPSYQPEVLGQVQNITIMGDPAEDAEINNLIQVTRDVWQLVKSETLDSYLYQNVAFHGEGADSKLKTTILSTTKLVNSDMDMPTPENVMVSTRFTNCPNAWVSTGAGDTMESWALWNGVGTTYSTEIVRGVQIIGLTAKGVPYATSYNEMGIGLLAATPMSSAVSLNKAKEFCYWTKFDYAPTIPVWVQVGNDPSGACFVDYMQDTNNYTVMNSDDLTRLHEAALMSEFYVPQIASLTRKPFKG